MDRPRLLPDAEPLPPRGGDRRPHALTRSPAAEWGLRTDLQPTPRLRRPPLPGTIPLGPRGDRFTPARARQVPAAQSRPRPALRRSRRLAMEQLPGYGRDQPAGALPRGRPRPRPLRSQPSTRPRSLPQLRRHATSLAAMARGQTPGRGRFGRGRRGSGRVSGPSRSAGRACRPRRASTRGAPRSGRPPRSGGGGSRGA